MKNSVNFVRTTLVGGVLFLMPIVVVVFIGGKALELAHKLVDPVSRRIPFESVIGLETPVVMAIAVLVLFCFLAGLFAQTRLAQRIVNALETRVLEHVPGYEFIRAMGERMLGVESKLTYETVLARIEDAWQFGFLVEKLENGEVAVFIPGAPNPYSGSVYLMTPDRVRMAGISSGAAMKCLKRLGAGSKESLRGLSLDVEPPK